MSYDKSNCIFVVFSYFQINVMFKIRQLNPCYSGLFKRMTGCNQVHLNLHSNELTRLPLFINVEQIITLHIM